MADPIDQLTYSYTGNQLLAVDDAVTYNNINDFFDNGHYYSINRTPEYLYDANGNLTQDLNKEIVNITYNELNLPKIIDFKNNSRIEYQYDALGIKKRQLVTEGSKLVKTTDFIGNFVYENNYPVYNSFDEGRIIYGTIGTYFAETYIKDHLGNIRVAFGNEVAGDTQQYGIRQVNSYYPFGMNINPLTANKISKYKRNEFLYNGKMFQDELGLDWLDYGARFYDGVIGRWHSVDPCADEEGQEVASPYCYVENNPIIRVDPNGKIWGPIIGAAVDYGFQVYDNYQQSGKLGYNEFVGNVNFVSVGLSAVTGGIVKTAIVETAKAAISYKPNEGINVKTDVKAVVEEAAVNTVISKGSDAVAGKIKAASSDETVAKAKSEVIQANNKVSTAEKKLAKSPNSTVKAQNVADANVNAQNARSNVVKSQMLNSTVGQVNQKTLSQTLSTTTTRIVKDEKKH